MKRKNALALFGVLAVVLLVADRITKNIAVDQLTGSGSVPFLPPLLDFVLVYNRGGAFGLFEGGGILFVIVALLAVIAIIVYLVKAPQLRLPVVLALALIAAGALGNAYDRATAGAVPDFLHTLFIEFPVFNVADISLTLGEIVLILVVAVYWFAPKKAEESAARVDATTSTDAEVAQVADSSETIASAADAEEITAGSATIAASESGLHKVDPSEADPQAASDK